MLVSESQREKASKFLSLHTGGRLLVLPNIWNPIGARVLEAKGYPAVATASAAVSASLGYADGERIKRGTLLDLLERIAASVTVPVTADIEKGFGDSVADLRESVRQVIATGVVGINIEDSLVEGLALRSIDEQTERISAIRAVAGDAGLHLVINARIDSFVSNMFQKNSQRTADAVKRANAYVQAGADCVYPMGPGDSATLRTLRASIAAPINILATAQAEPLSALQEIGINRVSFGPFIFRSCLRKFADIADALHNCGGYESFAGEMLSSDQANAFLRPEKE